MKHSLALSLLALAAAGVASPAFAEAKGDWTLGVGVHQVAPKSDNGKLVNGTLKTEVGNSIRPTITFEYFVADNVGVEVLGALPFKHEISLKGLGKVAETKQLPPVVSLQYHFANDSKVTPFVGVGVNYTRFFGTDTKGALKGSDIDLGSSWGVAAHAGLDFAVTDKSAVRVDVRWADIDSKVKLDGAKIGTANIDPMVYGVAYVLKF